MSSGEKKAQVDVGKLTDLEILLLVIERDVSQFKMERIDELLNKVGEAKGFIEAAKKETPSDPKPEISEAPFKSRKYQAAKGERLGEYEICFKDDNNADEWQHCFNILKANNATIEGRFSQKSWGHYYWCYDKNPDRFYRKTKSSS